MGARILNGKALANTIKSKIRKDVQNLKKKGMIPYLVAIQIGDHPSSGLYIANQRRACQKLGISYAHYHLDEKTPQKYLEQAIQNLNRNPFVTGIILQMPLPISLDPKPLYAMIHPKKDVEGMHPENLGRLTMGTPTMVPCTAMGAFELIKSTNVSLKGKEAVIVGHSEIVGKPISLLLLSASATTTTCHIDTRNLKEHTKKADILVVAAGVPGLITKDMVKPGVIAIDIGINLVPLTDEQNQPVTDEQGETITKTVGDFSPEVSEVASWMTPVPGGVGPMTVAMLLRNTVRPSS